MRVLYDDDELVRIYSSYVLAGLQRPTDCGHLRVETTRTRPREIATRRKTNRRHFLHPHDFKISFTQIKIITISINYNVFRN